MIGGVPRRGLPPRDSLPLAPLATLMAARLAALWAALQAAFFASLLAVLPSSLPVRCRLRFLARSVAPLAVMAALSACGLIPQQTPAPIVEHSFVPSPSEAETADAEEPSSAVVAVEPASEVKAPRPQKPKRRIVKPKPREPVVTPPPEEPPPPPPPQIISTRILQHDQLHGLLDSEVQRPDGKVIGRAVDVYVDTAAKPKMMLVNLSGFLGVGDRKVIFPWTAFRFSPASKTAPITLNLPQPAAGKSRPADPAPKPQPVKDLPPNLTQLVDSTVVQQSGARIGRVVDVLIDSQAQPQALVVDLSSSLAGDKRHVAANWADLHIVSRNKTPTLQMDFTDAQLKASPTYGPDQPIKIVSPVVPAPAPAAAASPAAVSSGAVAAGPVASGSAASGVRPSR